MADAAKADLRRALGRLARGLAALFWAIPLALIASIETARTDWMGFFGPAAFLPVFVLTLALWFGVRQLGGFQKQERVWQRALQRAELLALTSAGLAPFLFWWHRFPYITFYTVSVETMAVAGMLFLMQFNYVLHRLSAMLPDEMLQADARTFTSLNAGLLAIVIVCLLIYAAFNHGLFMAIFMGAPMNEWQERGIRVMLFLLLMPVGMTLALVWKIKESIFASLFQPDH